MPARSGWLVGLTAALRGARRTFATPEVGRAYLQMVAALWAVAVLLDLAGIYAVWNWTAWAAETRWWTAVVLVLLRTAGIAVVLLAAPLAALYVVNAAFPLLNARLFFAGLRALDPSRADALAAMEGLPWPWVLRDNLLRMLWFLGCSALALAATLVPVAGPILALVLQSYFSARALGWELLDPYFEKLGSGLSAQRDFVRAHGRPLVGFALPFSYLMAIPFVGPLAFGLAQAAAASLVHDVLERPDTDPPVRAAR